MSILDDLKQRQQQQQADAYEEYRGLVAQAAKSEAGTLPKAKSARLAELVELLGYPLERIEADLDVLRRHAATCAATEGRDGIQAARDTAQNELDAHEAETRRIVDERQPVAQQLAQTIQQHDQQLHTIDRAQQRRDELESAHWRLLGLADPSAKQRQRFIGCVIKGVKLPAIAFINIADIFASAPGSMRWDSPDAEYIPHDGQSEAEKLSALTVARDWSTGRDPRQPIILTTADLPELAGAPSVIRDADALANFIRSYPADAKPAFDVSAHRLIKDPRMKDDVFAAKVEAICKAYEKHPWVRSENANHRANQEFEAAQQRPIQSSVYLSR